MTFPPIIYILIQVSLHLEGDTAIRIIAKIIIFQFLLFILITLSASASSEITITTHTGRTYYDVRYFVHEEYQQIVFYRVDGCKDSVSFFDILKIRDGNWNDITSSILPWVVKSAEVIKTPCKQPNWMWSAGIFLGFKYGIPSGNYYNDVASMLSKPKSAFGFSAGLIVTLSNRFDFRLTFENPGIGFSSDWNPIDPSIFHFHGSIYYNFKSKTLLTGKKTWYFQFGLGILVHEYETPRVAFTDNLITNHIGGGIMLFLGKNIGLDLGVQINLLHITEGKFVFAKDIMLDFKSGIILLM